MQRVLPALHVRDGVLVHRDGMRWVPGGWPEWCPDGNAEKAARRLFSLFGEVVVVDHGGLASGSPDLELLDRLGRAGVAFWSDCGPRHVGEFLDVGFVGAEGIVVRCGWMPPAELEEALDVTDVPLFLGLVLPQDARHLPRYERLLPAATGILVVAGDALGRAQGFPRDLLKELPTAQRRYVMGGVATPAEARQLLDHGAEAVVVSTALLPDPEAWAELAAGGTLGAQRASGPGATAAGAAVAGSAWVPPGREDDVVGKLDPSDGGDDGDA